MTIDARQNALVTTERREDIDGRPYGFLTDSSHARSAAIALSISCSFVIGAAGMAGYLLNNSSLASVLPGNRPVAAVTGLCVMALGAATMLLRSHARIARNIARFLALSVAVTALIEIATFVSLASANMSETGRADSPAPPLHPYPVTALLLVVLSFLAMPATTAYMRTISHILGSLVFGMCLVLLFGYVFAVPWFVDPQFRVFPVLATTIAFLMLSAAALLINPAGWVRLLFSRTAAGTMSRLLLPAAIAIPMLIALAVHERHDGAYLSRGDLTIIVAVNMIFAAALILGGGSMLQRRESDSRRLAAMVESSTDAIYGTAVDGTILTWNRGAEQAYAYTAAEAIGASVMMLAPPDHASEIESTLDRFRRGERVESFETVRIRKDGRPIDVSIMTSPIRDESGAIIGVSMIARDITEQKVAARALLASEARFRSYFELGLVGMVTVSPDGVCLECNDRFCEMLGYERSELLGKTRHDLTHPDDVAADLANLKAVQSGERDSYSLDKRYVRKDGRVIHATISVACIRRPDASIDHFIALVHDVTERKLAEREIFRREQEFKALAENAPDVITRFSRDLRHRYVNPAVERMTGIPPSAFIGKTCRELGLPEEFCNAVELAVTGVFATGAETTIDFTLPSPSGPRFLQGRIVPEFGVTDEVEFALSITRDITTIRRGEERLRESEAQLASAQRIASIGSFEVDLETGRRNWSAQVFRLMGLPVGEPLAQDKLMSAITPEDRAAVLKAHEVAVTTGKMQQVEHRITVADGSERIFSIHIEPGRDAAGKIVTLTGTIQDVTALRETEQSLRHSEQRMRDLIESANDAILTLDTSGKVLEVNPAVVRIMGEPAEVLVGRHITHSIHPDYVEAVAQGLMKVIDTAEVVQIVAPVRTGHGHYIDIEATASRQSRKGANEIFIIGRDVTEERRAEAERQALTREIQLLLESTYEGIYAADVSGRCTLVNASAAAMLGYTPAEMIGKAVHELIHHRHADGSPYPAEDCPMVKAAKDGKPAHVVNEVFWRQDGTPLPVEIFISSILGDDKTIKGIVASFIDVTERQFLQTELERANRLTGLGRVAATMSHEFNNVLMGIQPFAEVLLRSSQDPRVIDAAKRITESVKRGRRVTEELRGFTRPVPPVRTPIDVRSWLSDCSTEFKRLLPSNVRFGLDIADTPMAIEADRDQMTQIISNVILNARDAIGSGNGSIKLTASAAAAGEKFSFGALPSDQSFVHFSVADDGPGMPPQTLSRIFEPFFTTKKSGTGLGLAITQQIITLHSGHLFVESKVGAGTTVHFLLPETMKKEEPVVTSPSSSSGRRRRPAEILLVEDDEAVASGVRALLEEEKINVLVVGDGAEAFKILETHKPQALVIDVGLPDCNGFDLYEQITASFGPLPVVFSSGHADAVRINDLKTSASVRMLTKPYVIDALLNCLEELYGDPHRSLRG